MKTVHVVGGGLAGSEASWQALKAGCAVVLHEMRPSKSTEAHKTSGLAELVCSNSFKSLGSHSASGRLKEEMSALDSLIVRGGHHARVPAGQALAVDRQVFSDFVEKELSSFEHFERRGEEVTAIPSLEEMESRDECWIIATGPLTSDLLAESLSEICGGKDRLYFYDAIAPVVDAESLDYDHCFIADRYGKGEGEGDYLNVPLSKDRYEQFIDAVEASEKCPLHHFETTKYFEACLPIEVMIERGRETLRFGPMKPVGLEDPQSGKRPWAVIQLRKENVSGSMYSLVGFQTKMKWPEQKRVFGLLPAFKNAEFIRFGSIHRNTYLQSPTLLREDLSLNAHERLFVAGQLTGVEGYTESAAIGLIAGRAAASKLLGHSNSLPPKATLMGALLSYVTEGGLGDFSPMNANLGLLPTIPKTRGVSKADRKKRQVEKATEVFETWLQKEGADESVVPMR